MTILIKNILLVDGTNKPAIKTDVLIKRDKIAAIGHFPTYKADEIIDGMGAYLTPGFIDINTNADLYLNLFSNPSQKEYLFQGVTTIVGGQSGISLAPLLYGSLELNKFWANTGKININWHTVGEFITNIKRKKIGVNFGTLIGHATIREALIGDEFRDLTQKELDIFDHIVERAMHEGAFGISFDLNFPLTSLTTYKEIKSIAEIVEKNKGLFSIKIRNASDSAVYLKDAKEKFLASVEEVVNLSKEIGIRTQINNFSCPGGFEKDYRKSLEIISDSLAIADISFNLHPHDSSVLPIFYFLPVWARRGNFKEMLKNLESKDLTAKIKKDLPLLKPEEIKIFQAPKHEYFVGKSLKDFCSGRNLSVKDGLLELMKITGLKAELTYKNLSLKTLPEALQHDRSIISSSFSGFFMKHPSNDISEHGRTFGKLLELVFKEKIIPLELAIKKITGMPARQLGIKNRGTIKVGNFADLVILRESSGIETVIVNGKIAVKDGEFKDNFSGKILTHPLKNNKFKI